MAAYSFDEGTGTVVTDLSGNGNHGTIGQALWTTGSQFGSALLFNGVNALVTIPDSPSLHLTDGMTLEAWVNPSVVDHSWRDVIYKADDNYCLEVSSFTNGPAAGGGTFGGNLSFTLGTDPLPANAWTHLAVTYDGTTVRLYVNGVLISSGAQTGQILTSSNPLEIGGDSLYGQNFDGVIDEVRIYNIALTEAQIQADMNTPIGGVNPAGPVASLSAGALNFNNQLIGVASTPQTVTLTNTGGADLTLGGITASGPDAADFAQIANCGASLQAGVSCNITIIYTPSHTGIANATIVIADDAAGNPHTVSLSGTGISFPLFSLSPSSASISSSGTQQFTVSATAGELVWSVDGIAGGSAAAGTISSSGLYSPPNQPGVHIVTVTTSDLSQSASATVTVVSPELPPVPAPVAAFSFNEGAGTVVTDSSGNVNHGTIENALWTASGQFGNALFFNGTDALVTIPDSPSLHLTNGMTLEAWVNPSAVDRSWRDVIYKADDNYFLEAASIGDGAPAGGVLIDGNLEIASGVEALPANVWTHLAVTYTGTNVLLYVNGALVSSVAKNGEIVMSANPLQIGGNNLYGQYFAGLIDEVRVYNVALTQAQIQSDMNTAITSGGGPTPALVSALECSPPTILSGASSTCTVRLSQAAPAGGSDVTISGSPLTVPALVTIAAGDSSAIFTALAGPVTADTSVTITASLNGSSQTASITISAPAPNMIVSGLQCSPTTIASGSSSSCTVMLSQAAPAGGSDVTISGAPLTVPALVTVAAGDSTATFTALAGPVTADISVTITASLNGSAATATLTIQAQPGGATGLVAAYSFTEGIGTMVADRSGNGHTGTIANATWTSSGRFDNALYFNGVNALVTIPDSPSLHLTDGMTLEAWVNPTTVDRSWRDVLYKADDVYLLEATSAGTGGPAGGASFGSDLRIALGTAALPANAWTHLALTYTGTDVLLYVNGALVSSVAQSGNMATSSSPLQIGGNNLYGQYFEGLIDEVRIYNVSLTQEQIQADMNAPVGLGAPAVVLSSSALTFANQLIGVASSPQTVTLTSTGGNVVLGSITVSGPDAADFAETSNCGSLLQTGGSCSITVIYTPSRTGTANATIVIAGDAPGNPHDVALTGTGISLLLSPSTASIAPNGNQQFTVSGATGDVVWSVDGVAGGSAAAGTITSSGLYSAPDQAGSHIIMVTSSDLSQSATASVTVTSIAGLALQLKLSENRRYLVDQNNVPFMVLGDSPQALIGNLSEGDAAFYFGSRQSAGFNTVWINLLCRDYTACRSDGSTFDGIPPFLIDGDISTPNEDYFRRADAMINLAAQFGLVVFLDPIETGGWLDVLRSNGTGKAFNYGAWVGNRYRNFPNIVWLNGNDFQTWREPDDDALVFAVARGIQSVDPNHLQTVELDFSSSNSSDDASWAPLISLNSVYTYFPTYAEMLEAYNQPNPIPVFLIEANYEYEQIANDETNPETLRRQEYWTALSGATGQFYGSTYSWTFTEGWQNNLDTTGAVQFGYLKNLLAARQWYNLIPDQEHTIVTAGYGTFDSSSSIGGNDYATVSATADGSLAIAYLPTVRTVSVDMTKFAGPVQAQWYDPANGAYLPISGAPFANTGSQQFMPPGNNSGGAGDWVLVLETNQAAAAGAQSNRAVGK